MADQVSDLAPRMHPDDLKTVTAEVLAGLREPLQALMDATARGPALPPPGRPPVAMDDLDARQFDRLKRDMLLEAEKAVRQVTSDFLPEGEINERIENMSGALDRRLDTFKNSFLDDVKKIVADECGRLRSDIFDIFDDLGMPLEKGEKRVKTRKRLDALFTLQEAGQEWKVEFGKALRTSSIGALITAIIGFFGYVMTRGGQH